ncbi:MAG: PEP/pyruvate-binding domain-containing protein, partial [Roseinatronobacter sp.]
MKDLVGQIVRFDDLGRGDVARVGGKNASLGEMVCHLGARGVAVPPGFATTSQAYWQFVDAGGLRELVARALKAMHEGKATLAETGKTLRAAFLQADWPEETAAAIRAEYEALCDRIGRKDVDVAVRSSATAEDLPDASFAGQQETFLNIRGVDALLDACRRCYASLFT